MVEEALTFLCRPSGGSILINFPRLLSPYTGGGCGDGVSPTTLYF